MSFYVLVDAYGKEAFFAPGDDSAPKPHTSETEAVKTANEYGGDRLILRAVASVTEVTKNKVTKIK